MSDVSPSIRRCARPEKAKAPINGALFRSPSSETVHFRKVRR